MKEIKTTSLIYFCILIVNFSSSITFAEEPPPLDESLFIANEKNCGEMNFDVCKENLEWMREQILKTRAETAKIKAEARDISEEALKILQERKNKGEL